MSRSIQKNGMQQNIIPLNVLETPNESAFEGFGKILLNSDFLDDLRKMKQAKLLRESKEKAEELQRKKLEM